MDAEPLAYTAHPTAKPKVTPMAVAGEQKRAAASGGLAALAGAALVVMGSAALMSSPRPASADALERPASLTAPERPFAPRSAARANAQMALSSDPTPAEVRPASPLPFAGDEVAPAADQALGAGSIGSGEPASAGPAAARAPREVHTLTSFDGTRTMTTGSWQPGASGDEAGPAPKNFPPAPPVWNRPLNWVQTNDLGFTYSGGQIRR